MAPDAAEDSEDFDFIDLEDLAAGGRHSRRGSARQGRNGGKGVSAEDETTAQVNNDESVIKDAIVSR